jgi:microcystin degradation protein MlrC
VTALRIGYCGLVHETNTFAPGRTGDEDFARYTWRGHDLLDAFRGTATSPGGVIDAVRARGHELRPLLYAEAMPSGLVVAGTYRRLVDRLVGEIRAAEPELDALVVSLHGAMAAEGALSADLETLKAIRAAVGRRLPVAVTLDLHGNVEPSLANLVQCVVGYATYPHIDSYERAREVADIVLDAAEGRRRPAVVVGKLPLLTVPQGQYTSRGAMAVLLDAARRVTQGSVLACSLFPGFPYADAANLGFAVTAVVDGDVEAGVRAVNSLCEQAWELRERFAVQNLAPAEAVSAVMSAPPGLVALVDVGDNIGGGTPGDGTVLVAELLRCGVRGAVATLADPEAVASAERAGPGGRFVAAVGGKSDPTYGHPVPLTGVVRWLGDGRFRYRCGYMTGKPVLPGRTAVVEAGGLEVVLTEHKVPTWDPEQLRVVGIEPRARRAVVLKAAVAWRAGYESLVSAVVEADTPGACTSNLNRLTYRHVPRPIYPLDPAAVGGAVLGLPAVGCP